MTILEKKQSKQLKFSILFHKFEKKAIFEIFHILMSFFEYVLFLRIFLLCIEARGRPPGCSSSTQHFVLVSNDVLYVHLCSRRAYRIHRIFPFCIGL